MTAPAHIPVDINHPDIQAEIRRQAELIALQLMNDSYQDELSIIDTLWDGK
ncbi:MAG: hypothetical protein U0518_00730 [Candidatus Gracilibacteria bacterium]